MVVRVSMPVDQIVIFEPDEGLSELRYERALRAFATAGLEIDAEQQLKLVGDRQELVELLTVGTGDRNTLLLCDMVDQADRQDVGSVGARLLRAIARDKNLAPSVWRILWSAHDHPTVIADIEPYAHAFVWFDHKDRQSEALSEAITHVLSGPPASDGEAGAPAFRFWAPRRLTAAKVEEHWTALLEGLLDHGQRLKTNDLIAAASIVRDVPDTVTNETLRAGRRSAPPDERRLYCESVNDLLSRLRGDTRQARRSLVTALQPYSYDSIATQLTPQAIDRAYDLMRSYVVARTLRYMTLLTEAEDELARVLVACYQQHLAELGSIHGSDKTSRHVALDQAVDDARVHEALRHPELAAQADTNERQVETMSYVIYAYNDTARSLSNGTAQAAG
jgi:hypothetical protein